MINIEDMFTDHCQKIDPWCVDAFFDLKLTPSNGTELTLDSSWGSTSVDLTPAIKAGETITNLLLTDTALQFNREDYGRKGAENGGVDCISGDALSRIISMKYLKDVSQNNKPSDGTVYMYDGSLFQPYNLQSFITTTNNTLTQHTQQIDGLQAGLQNLTNIVQNNYTSLNNKIDQTRDALQSQITTNANNIKTNTQNIAANAAAIKTLQTDVSTLKSDVSTLKGDVATLKTQVAALQTSVSSLRTDLTSLQSTVSGLQSDYNTFKGNTNNRLSTIESTIAKPNWAPADAVIAWGNINNAYNANPTGKGIYTHNPSNNVLGDERFQ